MAFEAAPLLPQLLPLLVDESSRIDATGCSRRFKSGAWLAALHPTENDSVVYAGTVRVENSSGGRRVSGDLYERAVEPVSATTDSSASSLGLNPQDGIPVQPIAKYRYYLSVSSIREEVSISGPSVQLEFNRWKFLRLAHGSATNGQWIDEGTFNATLHWTSAVSGSPSDIGNLIGAITDASGAVVGSLNLDWISESLRKAVLEIDSVSGIEQPLNNGLSAGDFFDWQRVFSTVSWDVTVIRSDTDIPSPAAADGGWSDAELHAGMLRWRNRATADDAWVFHLLCVKKIRSTARGIMYDDGGTDSDNLPREGAAIASSWVMIPGWGRVTGQRFGEVPQAYFRAAVHEIGHALNLLHNLRNQHFMDTSDTIAAAGERGPPSYPDNIKWSFADDDVVRLKHWPDVVVRPGGLPFGSSHTIPPVSVSDQLPNIELDVKPTIEQVPLGAPVRLEFTLCNSGPKEGPQVRVPVNLGFKSGFMRGTVTTAARAVKSFKSVFVCDEDAYKMLGPGEEVISSVTLLRGAEGALFESPGSHEVTVEVEWQLQQDVTARVVGSATVEITAPKDVSHATAAEKILTLPDVHLVLVFGGDHLQEGLAAMKAALEDDTLRPHFAAIEAKRLATAFESRKPDVETARQLLDSGTVFSRSEKEKLERLLNAEDS